MINDSLLISSFAANDTSDGDDNYCLRIDNTETAGAAIAGDLQLNSVIFACQENAKGNAIGTFASEQAWAENAGNQFATVADGTAKDATAANDADLQLLEGVQPVYSIDHATSQVDGAAPLATTAPTAGSFLGGPSDGSRLGGRLDLWHRSGQQGPGTMVRITRTATKAATGALAALAAGAFAGPAVAQSDAEDDETLEEVVVTGRFLSSSQSLVNERLADAFATDLLGEEAISRLGDSTVAAALRRVPGLTLVQDKYVYIRGLGERYSQSTLKRRHDSVAGPDAKRHPAERVSHFGGALAQRAEGLVTGTAGQLRWWCGRHTHAQCAGRSDRQV